MRLRFDFRAPVVASAAGGAGPLEFTSPTRLIVAHAIDDVIAAVRDAERAAIAGQWVAGFLSYEAASVFDAALVTHAPAALPLAWFAVFAGPSTPAPVPTGAVPAGAAWHPRVSDADYRRGFAAVKTAIAAGDSYQANYTLRLESRWLDDPWLRYDALVAAHRPPYAACLDLDDVVVVSLSPELFLATEGRQVRSAPMKGTARRGRWPEEDVAQAAALAASAKDRAENVMIVDLVRNDLGRVTETGSVHVESLFELQRFRTAWQMVSTVTGTLGPGIGLADALAATFPAGSITGAPKTSTMRLIRQIEPEPRGVYCGAIGLLVPGGDAVFNVAIRTAVVDHASRRVVLGVGGGITWDSAPADELAEAHLKATFLDVPPPFALLETMQFDGTTLRRWDQHLARLLASAAYFDVPCDAAVVTTAVQDHVVAWRGSIRRVRLTLPASGVPEVASSPLEPSPTDVRVAVSAEPVSSDDVFLCHKTTHRDAYARRRAARPDVFDVLLVNEHGALTEFTIGNLVLDVDGRLLTPPRAEGLLAGVFRQVLLAGGQIEEQRMTTDDLGRATRAWLVNSVREWLPVTFVP